ncbi:hypothetical protein JF544_02455 [Halobacillus kuroshimensis]|uniref:Phage capsid protein n=1 Tax=Halobacillus kuroshimensis TaxID=302481 RepID=A0ABS3DRY0_9BACI|nr:MULTISPECIES: DUF6366 family protein [Halobacillus]MBN8234085.1 hypothetical protein [Halobacillus kuroshimensis]
MTKSDKAYDRERMRQKDLKRNSPGREHSGGLMDLAGGLGWKGTGLILVGLILAFLLFSIFR